MGAQINSVAGRNDVTQQTCFVRQCLLILTILQNHNLSENVPNPLDRGMSEAATGNSYIPTHKDTTHTKTCYHILTFSDTMKCI